MSDVTQLDAAFWLYYKNDLEERWHSAPATHRQQLIQQGVRYITALDTDLYVGDEHSGRRATAANARYRGDLYIDLDFKDDVMVAVKQASSLLDKLDRLNVDPASVRLYLSGGKGVHIEIPAAIFAANMEQGVLALPTVYKTMAFEFVVDTMDTNVYSAGRGRLWRGPNTQREDGKYKVPVTAEMLSDMTAERYSELVQAPQPEPGRAPPRFCPTLADIYNRAVRTVQTGGSISRSRPAARSTKADSQASDVVEAIQLVAAAAVERIDGVLDYLLPDGYWDGRDYVALNPRRDDKTHGSFKVHPNGWWKDFAAEDHKGGDLVALWRFCRGDNMSMLEAARQLAEHLEIDFPAIAGDHKNSRPDAASPLETKPSTNVISAAELVGKDMPSVRWIVEGLLPEGLSILAGSPKAGKSWMVLDIAIAAASGATCLGGRRADNRRVLYLALEDNYRRLRDRLVRLLGAPS